MYANYIPIKVRNYGLEHCPKCVLRLINKEEQVQEVLYDPDVVDESEFADVQPGYADVLIDWACPKKGLKKRRTKPPQITVGGCAESSAGTGAGYYKGGIK